MKVVWTQAAVRDRRQIVSYLLERNPAAALKFNKAVLLAADRLERLPERGRPGRVQGTRELAAVLPYLLIYELDQQADVVRILRVWHTSRERDD